MWFLLVIIIAGGIVLGTLQMQGKQPVRCPSCTQFQWAPKNAKTYNCSRCGTAILQDGQFVQAQASGHS